MLFLYTELLPFFKTTDIQECNISKEKTEEHGYFDCTSANGNSFDLFEGLAIALSDYPDIQHDPAE
jgi:hypothetical protein